MANKDANYDKVLLGIAAVLAIGGAGYIYTLIGSFSENLATPKSTKHSDYPDVAGASAVLDSAKKNLAAAFNWVSPERNGKPVPLNVSIPVVLKDGNLIDMFTENPSLRPPMTNKFLRDNQLDFLAPNVGDQDPDGDSFTNLEEFNKQTNPKDPKSHPPLTDKLYFVDRVQHDYLLTLSSSELPVLVKLVRPDEASASGKAADATAPDAAAPAPAKPAGPPRGVSSFVSGPFPFDFGFEKDPNAPKRFTATGFTKKTDPSGKDVSELAVTDKSTGKSFVLIYKVQLNLAEYEAQLEYLIGPRQEFTVKKGGTFRISGVASTYKVVDVAEDSATISEIGTDGKDMKPFVAGKHP